MDNLNNRYIPVREKIFSLLKFRGIQQKDFAEAIGVPQQTVTDWKGGRSFSFAKRLDIIAQVLETTTSELLGEEKPTPVAGDGLTPEFVRLYEQLSEEEKTFVVKQMKGLLAKE